MQAKNWVFTLNNPTRSEGEAVENLEVPFLIYGKELGETGTPHLQGYVQLEQKRRLASVKELIPRAHLEIARGTVDENIKYCSKQDPNPFIKGTPVCQGQRNDLISLREAVRLNPISRNELVDQHLTVAARYPRVADMLHDIFHPPQDLDKLNNEWFVGPPGNGKSRTARQENPSHFAKYMNKWFDGYDNEDTIIIEEVGPQHATFASLLKIWADHYVFTAESKGSSRKIRPSKIIVTSNYDIDRVFMPEDAAALSRRFTVRNFH